MAILDTASKVLIGVAIAYAIIKLIGFLSRLGIKQITPKELELKKGFVLLDVRTNKEFDQGRIPGAVHVPLTEVGTRVKKLKKDKEVVVYCQSGTRSIWAIKRLIGMGYKNLYNLKGGYNAWKRLHR
ncbi:MAG TPA: rhodanese-like domain-containing protein [Nitrospiraceae bacterium]|nr:rhodanese-like domain-containing protein [Nitrospiraceae bacterium]HAS54179.1 rhodanese-like domain-containing protein [Nitrospiraceae bacterium]